jgi:hypothetical protein
VIPRELQLTSGANPVVAASPEQGWHRDVLRAAIVTILYFAGLWLGLAKSFLYGGGFVGYFPLLFFFFLGPWMAAWVALKFIPSDHRLLLRLGAGTFAGLVTFYVLGAIVAVLTPKWRLGDPPSRFTEHDEAVVFIAGLLLCLFAGILTFSRWKRRSPEREPATGA